MPYKVRFANPQKQYADHKEELLGAIDDVLTRGALVNEPDRAKFEQTFADFLGVKHGIAVNSGTSALDVALAAAQIGPGDEVITAAHTFIASISTICITGATAVLIDIGNDMNMDVAKIEAAITPKTKAILPVHFNGRLCDMEAIMTIAKKHNLLVIEDAAQALGATMKMADGTVKKGGAFGFAGCFSLYWAKALGGMGVSGIVVTNDDKVAAAMRLLRFNGEDRISRHFYYHAHNFLMDNVHAAFLSVKMKYLPEWFKRRQEIAELYRKGFEGVSQIKTPHFDDARRTDIFNNYVVRTDKRDGLEEYLTKNELVETLVQWKEPTYTEPIMVETKNKFWRFGSGADSLPETEKICKEVISLPMYPELTNNDINAVINAVKGFYSKQ